MAEDQNGRGNRRGPQGGGRRDDRRPGGNRKGFGGGRGASGSAQSRGPKRYDRTGDERKPRKYKTTFSFHWDIKTPLKHRLFDFRLQRYNLFCRKRKEKTMNL